MSINSGNIILSVGLDAATSTIGTSYGTGYVITESLPADCQALFFSCSINTVGFSIGMGESGSEASVYAIGSTTGNGHLIPLNLCKGSRLVIKCDSGISVSSGTYGWNFYGTGYIKLP